MRRLTGTQADLFAGRHVDKLVEELLRLLDLPLRAREARADAGSHTRRRTHLRSRCGRSGNAGTGAVPATKSKRRGGRRNRRAGFEGPASNGAARARKRRAWGR